MRCYTEADTRSQTLQFKLPVNDVYDPTNGISSHGDIVFHRRAGDDFLFSFQGDMPLRRTNFIKRDLDKTLKKMPN